MVSPIFSGFFQYSLYHPHAIQYYTNPCLWLHLPKEAVTGSDCGRASKFGNIVQHCFKTLVVFQLVTSTFTFFFFKPRFLSPSILGKYRLKHKLPALDNYKQRSDSFPVPVIPVSTRIHHWNSRMSIKA